MKSILHVLILIVTIFNSFKLNAQYYNAALGLNGPQLKTSLHNIIKGHTAVLYATLWTSFQTTDKKLNGDVWDMYTDIPGGIPVHTYQFITDQCGNYNAEGDCYNREHSWPKEYFGGDNSYTMYSDLHHLFATDGWVNNKHAAFPFGNITNASYTSSNGTKVGTGSTYAGYTNKLFEPIDSFKGDFARAYFYMSTRYEGEDAGWNNWEMANGAELTPEAITLLLLWHHNDPVSQKEIDRNEAVFLIQGNRNPFVDYPQFADCIWGTSDCTSLGISELAELNRNISMYPNPSRNILNFSTSIDIHVEELKIFSIQGTLLRSEKGSVSLDISNLQKGTYFTQIQTNKGVISKIIIKE